MGICTNDEVSLGDTNRRHFLCFLFLNNRQRNFIDQLTESSDYFKKKSIQRTTASLSDFAQLKISDRVEYSDAISALIEFSF